MDVLTLSRIQFAVATLFHYLFVPLTLGLTLIVALMETRYVRTKDEQYKLMAKFWGKLMLINFAVGVVTGITLEFQFGTNWSRYSAYVGDIFGSLLAIEATVAFFLESTFIAVWFFGWDKLSPRLHAACMWIVAIASNISAFWIICANAWMQNPVGYVIRNGRAELESFTAVITQPYAILEFLHTLGGAYILSGMFVLGISAMHLYREREVDFFHKSFKLAAAWVLVFSLVEAGLGHASGMRLAKIQPAKLAAMESHWETRANAPFNLLTIPKLSNDGNHVATLPIPGALSILAGNSPQTVVKGLNDFPKEDRPPVLPVFLAFRGMVALGSLFILIGLLAFWKRNEIMRYRKWLWILPWMIPLPYLANELGWIVTEMGRQPWIVYGLMRTSDAVSLISAPQVAATLVAFVLVYGLLGLANFYLLFKFARKGPDAVRVRRDDNA